MNDMYFLSSPYGGKKSAQKLAAAIAKILHVCDVGPDPIIVPHLMLPCFFDDSISDERGFAIDICKRMILKCDEVFFYAEFGFSPGMMEELRYATDTKIKTTILMNSSLWDKYESWNPSGINTSLWDQFEMAFLEYGKEVSK